jgi:branched-chain amino acid transport system ATP-binding protein
VSSESDHPAHGEVPRETALAVRGVDSGYGEAQVLDDLNLYLNGGEIVCLIGPNGAGKSTVLKTIFGLLKPWTGTVTLGDEDISGTDPEDLVRMGVGYVPQVDNVFGSLTIDENLRMGGVARESGLDAVVSDLYERFPILDEKRQAKARTLSGGQRQVLAFARALVMEPDVLLIDEPSAGLAPSIVEDVFEDVQTVNELGTAILMVEQNAREGLAISDRGYVLDQGTVAYEDDADGLLDNPEVSQLYLGGADYEGQG